MSAKGHHGLALAQHQSRRGSEPGPLAPCDRCRMAFGQLGIRFVTVCTIVDNSGSKDDVLWLIMTTCQHKSVFWDEDETRCRTCPGSAAVERRTVWKQVSCGSHNHQSIRQTLVSFLLKPALRSRRPSPRIPKYVPLFHCNVALTFSRSRTASPLSKFDSTGRNLATSRW